MLYDKALHKRSNKTTTDTEKMFAIQITNRGLIPRIDEGSSMPVKTHSWAPGDKETARPGGEAWGLEPQELSR